jgi:hypothetical protein
MPTHPIKPLKLSPVREEMRPSSTAGRAGLSRVAPGALRGIPSAALRCAAVGAVRQVGGKVVHDSRGNAMWDWAVATGVLAGTKSAELLRMLDNPTLALEGDCELVGEWAGDPYNRS